MATCWRPKSLTAPGGIRSAFDYAQYATMKRAAAVGPSPNRIMLLRDADGDGVAEVRETFLEGLNQPFGMALIGETLYVGNTDGIVAFPYKGGETKITAPGKKLTTYKTEWPLDAQPDRQHGPDQALCRRRFAEQYRR